MKAAAPEVNFPQVEKEALAKWERENTFHESNRRRQHGDSTNEFIFCDGPPFANGLPHYGHLLASTIKDTVCRYWNMRGYYVDRRFGWDTHGVPVEFEVEKREGLKGRTDILAMGIEKFNDLCRQSALHYIAEWKKTITRLGRWVDWDNQYRTMDRDFMESVWWVISELDKKGLLYRGFKVVPYSPRITAVLSNFEANQNYKEIQSPAITVRFKAKGEDAHFLGWTTTPWTLISNLSLCVGPEISYVKFRDKESSEVYYIGADLLPSLYKKNPDGYEVLDNLIGNDLKGRQYEPLFPYFKDSPRAFQILVDDYVSTDDGTAIVHQAPAYGEDDFRVTQAAGIDLVDPVDDEGRFTTEIPEYVGQFVKDADKAIIRRLKDEGKLYKQDTIVHSYPFCERTDEPLIYKAVSTWYVSVEKIKEDLIANNQKINWVPGHLKDGRMGRWLEGARDWAISRNRFWGNPLPIWVCDEDPDYREVLGSIADLEAKVGHKIEDIHSHHIDQLTYKSERGTMRRVPEVLDCWFESGSMPYAQIHYPFEKAERFQEQFPADFIAEGQDQTRGWFYTLNILSTALFGQPAFKNVVVNGMVLAQDGKKMSKRLQNYTAPDQLLDQFGADSVRLYMLNSAVLKGGDLSFTDQGVRDTTRAVLLPLWNAFSFLSTYAEADGWQPHPALANGNPPSVTGELDRWIISRLQTLLSRVHQQMDSYQLYAVVPPVLDFIEDLTNWYIRLSRKRFWGTDRSNGSGDVAATGNAIPPIPPIPQDTEDAYQTLYYVLCNFTKVFAPFAPFLSEHIYGLMTAGMSGDDLPNSVHLCDTPTADDSLVDLKLEQRMELVRRATDLGRSLRAKHKIKTRQVLPSMTVITRFENDRAAIEGGQDILRSELNIKEISFSTEEARFVALSLKPNLKTLGKRLGKQLNELRQHLQTLNQAPEKILKLLSDLEDSGKVNLLGHDLEEADFLIERGPKDDRLIATGAGVTVLLDTKLSDELILEGLSREIVNRIQKLRKDSGLQVTDRIHLELVADGKLGRAVELHRDYIARETLASDVQIRTNGAMSFKHTGTYCIDSMNCRIGLSVSP